MWTETISTISRTHSFLGMRHSKQTNASRRPGHAPAESLCQDVKKKKKNSPNEPLLKTLERLQLFQNVFEIMIEKC